MQTTFWQYFLLHLSQSSSNPPRSFSWTLKQNINWIGQQIKNFPIEHHCKNHPLSATLWHCQKWAIFMPPDNIWRAYCFCPVCLFVCLFVCLRTTLTLAITFKPLQIETWYLACICICSSHTFWGVICQGQCHPSMSKVKYIGQKVHFHFGHSSWSNRDRSLIFGVQVHLMRLHILSG